MCVLYKMVKNTNCYKWVVKAGDVTIQVMSSAHGDASYVDNNMTDYKRVIINIMIIV